uniref:cobalamin biosynthesis family protein n=1 Tax=Thaumasiovibrio occultus TaxID=1891184 RepID=UPI000B3598F2|nr:cobalamin biosynthesis family protein [Thaumasiovibrio occultus]
MWGALALHWLVPISPAFHPLHWWQRLAFAIADKVNKSNDAPSQRQISGLMAWLLMWLSVLIFLIALRQLVFLPAFFNLLLLWLALDWKPLHQLSSRLQNGLAEERLKYCRYQLSAELNRDTDRLTLVGLGKAAAETLLIGYGRRVIGVLFWYCVGGGIAAIMYRLAVGLARYWSPTRPLFAFFGTPAVRILAVLDLLPMRLFALSIICGQHARTSLQSLRQQGEQWLLPGPGWLLAAAGSKLSLSLGGPVIYAGTRHERPTLGGQIAPAGYHLALLHQLIINRIALWLIVSSILLGIL